MEAFRRKLLRRARTGPMLSASKRSVKRPRLRRRHGGRGAPRAQEKAGIEKTRKHNAAKKLEAERGRRARLGLPSPGETSSWTMRSSLMPLLSRIVATTGVATNDEIEDSDEDDYTRSYYERRKSAMGTEVVAVASMKESRAGW